MLKSLLKSTLLITTLSTFTLFAQDTTDVSWGDGTPGTLEAAITGPGVYRLEAGKVYLTLEHIPVETGAIHIVGATPQGDGHPAVIQPLANAEGALGHTNGELFTVVGDGAELALKHLIINAAAAGGEGSLHGCASARGALNKIIVDDCIVTHVAHLAFFTMGTQTDFHIENSVIKAFTNGPGGMFYGGLLWGGGSWMGTIDTLVVRNNTIDGVVGEGMVVYEHVDYGIVDHNTFTNVVMDLVWYRGHNNLQISNNLLYNTKSYGQSTYDVSGWGVWHSGGVGQMAEKKTRPQDSLEYATTGSFGTYTMGDGQVVDNDNRNVNWFNNAAVWSPAMVSWVDNLAANPWSWNVNVVTPDTTISGTDTTITFDTTVVAQHDTMLTVAQQAVWACDTTLAAIAQNNGVTSTNNAMLSSSDLGMNLDEMYITHQLARTLDFRDDQSTQGVGANNEWQYEHDGSWTAVEWPMHYDASYSTSSVAATHSTTGGPIGSNRWMEFELGALTVDNSTALPKSFALKQNYPNPFNPSTEIAFSLEQTSNITLTIFNVLGQKVKVLADGSKQAGTHSLSWDGRDQMGAMVSTGLYFYTLTDGNTSITKKMALMK